MKRTILAAICLLTILALLGCTGKDTYIIPAPSGPVTEPATQPITTVPSTTVPPATEPAPTEPEPTLSPAEALLEVALSDKKRSADGVNLIGPRQIGCCEIVKTPYEALKTILETGL